MIRHDKVLNFLCEKSRQDNVYSRALSRRRPVAPGRLMRSIWATRPTPSDPSQIHPALNSFADECRGMLVHLTVYLGGSGVTCHHRGSSMGGIA